MKWIKVSEDPPSKELGKILVYSITKNIHTVYWDYDDWNLQETDSGACGDSVVFTHWMPLPEPPIG